MNKINPIRLLTLALVASTALTATAQPSSTVDTFLAAFNSGDAEAMLAFYRTHATPEFLAERKEEEIKRRYQNAAAELGALTEVRRIAETATKIRVEARAAKGGRVKLTFELEPAPPHRLADLAIAVTMGGDEPERATLPPFAVAPGSSLAATRTALDAYLRDLTARDLFSGVVTVARGGETLFEGAYGQADRERGTLNTLNTRFDVGSITKTITQVAISQLARAGKLSFDDTVAKLLPDYPNREVAARITVRQLLRHQSGLGDFFGPAYRQADKAKLLAPRDFYPLFAAEPLAFEPGSSQNYSNAGYIVLGGIIEAVSGMSYPDYVARNIFLPAGMSASGFLPHDRSLPHFAVGYTRQAEGGADGPLKANLGILPLRGCAAGSSAHTAGDLLRFYRALGAGKLLDAAGMSLLFRGELPKGELAADEFAAPQMGIAGGAPGVTAGLEARGKVVAIVLSNLDPPIATELAARLLELEAFGAGES